MASDIPWRSIKALTFDIYGTLIDWNKGVIDAARATSLGPYLPKDDQELLAHFGKHAANLERDRPTLRKADLNAEGLRLLAADLGVVGNGKLSNEELEKVAKEFGDSIGSYEIFPDTLEAMFRLRKHYKLIALSNIDHASLNATLSQQFGSSSAFDACYIAEDIGSYKPNLKNFDYLLDHMKTDFGIDKDQICHVAQSLFHDHPATKQMGIRSVWIDRYGILERRGRSEEDMKEEFGFKFRTTDLKEVADVVEKALGEQS